MPRLRLTPQERQRLLWEALESYISRNGGWVTSVAYAPSIRFEVEPGSELPELLRDKGYALRDAGATERFLPVAEEVKQRGGTKITVQHLVPTAISIFQLELPQIG
jgi:hypothetical protein